ncbi:MAG: antitoxin MazE family protein [Rhodanobacteraceae bacterium]
MSASHLKAIRVKVQRHRDSLRDQGLRPIQIWVPDVDARSFRAAAHKQSLAVAMSPQAADDQAFIDSISDWNE